MHKLILIAKNGSFPKYLVLIFSLLAMVGLGAQTTFEGFENGNPTSIPWSTNTPNNQWGNTTLQPYSGSSCAISGGYHHNTISNLNLNINVLSAGNVSFYMRTDTEYWGAVFGDFLRFYIDGVLQGEWAGSIGWTLRTYPISAGVHNLSWSFNRDNSDTYWDGFKSNRAWIDHVTFPANTFFMGAGTGSAGDPYQISSAAQLNSIRNYVGSTYSSIHFKLMNDIDLSAYLAENGEGYNAWGNSGWLPIGTNSTPFQAHFDGNFKTISGLMINRSTYADCGFFGTTGSSSLIENLSLRSAPGSSVQGGNAAGMLVGRNNGTIANCSASGSVRGSLWNGGLVGWNNGTLNHCCSSGDVISTGNTVGGLVGQNNGYINHSYSRAAARGNNYVGGLVGYQTQSGAPGIAGSYATGSVTNFGDPSTRGGLLGYLTQGTVSNSYWDTQSTGMATSYGSASNFGKTTLAMQTQATFTGWDFAGESMNGTADYWFISSIFNDAYPYLVWQQTGTSTPVMPHISVSPGGLAFGNQYINTTNSQTFTIANIGQLTLTGTISTPDYYTLTAGSLGRNTLSFSLTPGSSQLYTLSFAPLSYGTFNGSVVISSNSETESTYHLAVTGICIPVPETFAGGSGSQADPWLISTPGQLSRLNDFLGTDDSDRYFKIINDIDMTDYFLEGNPGYNYGYFWTPIGKASGGDNKFHGKVDGNHCTISAFKTNHLNNTGFESNIGLFGYTGSGFQIKNLNLITEIVAGWHQVGGLVGANSGLIDNCHVTNTDTGNVIGLFGVYCGGLVGINYGTITKCSFRGNVQGTLNVGGLVGSGGNIYDSFATGSVIGYDKVGGFVGTVISPGAQIVNCFAAVTMTYGSESSTIVGGFVSQTNNAIFTSCYWDRQLSNLNTSAGISSSFGKTTAEMQTTSTYVGWDMSYIWEHFLNQNGGYPQIRLAPATMIFNQQEFAANLLLGSSDSQNLSITNTGAQVLALQATVEYQNRGIQTILNEDFEQGSAMPAGWTQEYVSGDNLNWSFRQGSPGLPNYAHNGYRNANLIDTDSDEDKTMLITPALDLASISYSPKLDFFYYMQALPYARDSLTVYYRTSATGAWILLQSLESVNYWASCTIDLPSPSSEYYIGFEGNAGGSWGISIDDVKVFGSPIGYTDSWLSLNNQQSISSLISSRGIDTVEIGFHADHLSAGTYHAIIQFHSNAYQNWDPVIPVTLEVGYGDNPQITVSSTGFSFAEILAGTSSAQNFTIDNVGGAALVGTILFPTGYTGEQTREQRNILSFSIPEGSSQDFQLNFVPMTAATYEGNITITSNSFNDDSILIPVTGQAYTNPTISVDTNLLSCNLAPGNTASQIFTIGNAGSRTLEYSINIAESLSPLAIRGSKGDRSIAGSTLSVNQTQYTAGTTQDWVFTVHNAGSDAEWLKYVHLDFPDGVIVNSVSNFIGGMDGPMIPDVTSGDGINIVWTGIGSSNWGVVHDGESAVATINLTIPYHFNETLSFPYQILGDIYGAEPHSVSDVIYLDANITSVPWFSLDPREAIISGNSTQVITGYFSAEGMEPGRYEAVMTISTNDPIDPVRTVPIVMEVAYPVPVLRIGRDGNSIFLDWDAVGNATSYKIYRSSSSNSDFILIDETDTLNYSEEATTGAAFYQIRAILP